MSSEITAQDQIALAKTGAWHGIGNVLPDAMTPAEAITAADLDWEVMALPQFFVVPGTPEEDVYESQYSKTVVRMPREGKLDREGKPEQFIELSSVGPAWEAIQNRQMFDMVETALGQGVRLETAGSLQQGRKVFALLRADSFHVKGGNDEVAKYLLLANGHDAQFTFRAIPTSIRVVCANTLKMALQGRGAFTIRHVGDTEDRLKTMGAALQNFKATGSLFQDKVEFLARKDADTKALNKLWKEAWKIVHGPEIPKEEEAVAEMKTEIESWTAAMEVEKLTLGEQNTTMWLAANAVTNVIQHVEPKRKTSNWKENRQVSALFGSIDDQSTKIMQAALALA